MEADIERIFINGIGVITPQINELGQVAGLLENPALLNLRKIENAPCPEGMNSRDMRRMAPLTRFSLYAAYAACSQAGMLHREDCGVMVGLTHGATSYLREFHDYMFEYGPQMASPNAFSNGVTNAPLGAVSTLCGLTAGGATILGYEHCGMQALHHAALSIADGVYNNCICGAAEERSEIVIGAYEKLGLLSKDKAENRKHPEKSPSARFSEGSAFLALTRDFDVDNTCCVFSPAADLESFCESVDIIISGAAGALDTNYEMEILERVLSKQKNKPSILFSKEFFGETFSVSGLLSCVMACDILLNQRIYPMLLPHKADFLITPQNTYSPPVQKILVISASRNKGALGGVFQAP